MARRGNNEDNLSELNCENQQTSQYKRPRYKCNCGFSTFHHSEIVRHINTVAGAKRECPYCKQMYVNSNYGYSKMKLHMEKEHKKVFELEQWKPIETNPDARKQNFRIDEANSFERDSESNLSIGSHNKTVLRVRPQPKSTAPSEEKDVRLQSVISRIERESTRSNFEETRNEDGDESRLKEAMSPSRIPDTPDQSMDTERTILRSNSSSGNISRRPAKRQGLGGSSRLMVADSEDDEESDDEFPSVIPASPDLATNSTVARASLSVGKDNQKRTRLNDGESSSILGAASSGTKNISEQSELRYSRFEPCKESTMLPISQRSKIILTKSNKTKCKVKLPKTIQLGETSSSRKKENNSAEASEYVANLSNTEDSNLRRPRNRLLETSYFMNMTNKKQMDPENKTLQRTTMDLFEDVDPELYAIRLQMQLLEKAEEELVNTREVRKLEEMHLKQTYEKLQSQIAEMKMEVEELASQVKAKEMEREKVADTLYDHEELLEMFGVDIQAGKCSEANPIVQKTNLGENLVGDICNIFKCPNLTNNTNSNTLQMSQRRLRKLRDRTETARKAWRFKREKMEEMISRETLALESAKSRKRKQEKDLAKHTELLHQERNLLMRLRNFFKTQAMKIIQLTDGSASIQFTKLKAEIKFKHLDLAHLDFELDTVVPMFDGFEDIKRSAAESANTSTQQDRFRQLLLSCYKEFESLKEAKTKRDQSPICFP